MGISKQSDYWTARLNGNDPTSPVGDMNVAWTLNAGVNGDGVSQDGYWRISSSGGGQFWKQTVADNDNDLTLMCAIHIESVPNNGEVIMALDNGSHRVEVHSNGGFDKLKLVGATTTTSNDLDLAMNEQEPVPCILRLTLSSSGVARLYMREIIEDDDAQQHYLEVSAQSSSAQGAFFGTTSGTVDFYSVYFTPHGAYSPDEMDMSDFISHSLLRTGMKVVEVLKNSNRLFLKTHVKTSGVRYGYDLSSNSMINRFPTPSVHVMVQKSESPEFLTLAGTRTDQRYDVVIFVTTKGTNYENSYRLGTSILGEVFDELYTKTGLESGVDSLISYDARFDTKVDDDEVVCIHSLTLTYMKKIRMFLREA
tara:strand:- start:8902 stop:9999 length:1098 start_codon:yes stop_codon:yes gene_type:complete